MEYDELVNNILKEKKENKADRFNPPEVEVQQVGQKTVVFLDKLSKYINRPVGHISKFLMHELTAPGQIDESGKVTLGGRFSRKLVNEKITQYIKEFVICKQCGSPDTQMEKVEKNYFVKCLGCGAEYPVGRIK
ncbi:MAG: translation initiation factor IF-2 subunit beta [Candidatus Parvarchaeum sp.]